MDLKFTNFSSVYEILAGVSSALAIFDFIKKYILGFLAPHLDRCTIKIKETIAHQRLVLEYAISISSENRQLYIGIISEVKKCRKELRTLLKYVTYRYELDVISQKLDCLLWQNFFYCLFILIVGGLDASNFFGNNYSAFDLVANTTILSFGFATFDLLKGLWPPGKKTTKWYRGIIYILIAAALSSFFLVINTEIGWKSNKLIILFCSLGMAFFPFIVLIMRAPVYRLVIYSIIRRELKKTNKKLESLKRQMQALRAS